MFPSTKQFTDALDAQEITYTVQTAAETGKEKDVVLVAVAAENTDLTITFIFEQDYESAALRIFDFCKVPESKNSAILTALNAQNNRFRFAKFVLDEEEHWVQVEMDAVFRAHDVGEICFELLYRMVDICDAAYPALMKALWN